MCDFVGGPVRVGAKNLAAQVIGTGHWRRSWLHAIS
jgi:hypothetical protein